MNGKRPQVLFISSWYPNRIRPLLGIFFKRHITAIAQYCDVASISVFAGDKDHIEEATEDGIYTIRAEYRKVTSNIPVLSQFIKARKSYGAYRKAAELYRAKKGKPDLIHLNVIIPAGIVVEKLSRMWNVPFVIEEQWTGYFPEDGRYNSTFVKYYSEKIVKRASAIITISNDLKNKMLEVGLKNDYHVISNIVDTGLFNIPAQRKSDGKARFIHVSSLDDRQKNVSGIIRAFANIYKENINTELVIVGEGEEKTALMELSKSLGLTNTVQFVGEKTKQELVNLIQQSDAFVLFSNYETQAIVLLESLCCGVPVIATKAAGIGEYVNSENGILVEPKNEQRLADAMSAIINDKDRFKNSVKIRASVADKVKADVIAKQFLEVYNNVLSRK